MRVATTSKKSYPLFLLTGNDTQAIEAEAKALFAKLAGDDPGEFNTDIISEDERGPRRELIMAAINAVKTPAFMGGTKTVWLKNFTGFAAEGTAKSKSDTMGLAALAAFIAGGLPPEVNFIISGPDCDGKKMLATTCAKVGEVRVFRKPERGKKNWREDMAGCLQAVANRKGITLTLQTRDALIDALGGETQLIDCELDKLSCYVGPGRTITPDDVHELCASATDEPGWAINDIIGRRDLSGTLAIIERLQAQEHDPDNVARGLINALAARFLMLLQIRLFMAEHHLRKSMDLQSFLAGLSSTPEKKKELLVTDAAIVKLNPWVAKFSADACVNFTPHEMINAICVLRDALVSTVAESVPATFALTNAVLKILNP
jgi:DNA polymerase III delta subunit